MRDTIGWGLVPALLLAAGCASTTGAGPGGTGPLGTVAGSGGAGGTAWLTPPAGLPPTLAVPLGAALKLHDRGTGAQIYTCTSRGGGAAGTTYAWVLKAPDARLLDESGAQVGTHGAGPTWRSSDGSVVNGAKIFQESAPTAGAIPWLLLRATSNSGTGVFSDVTYVQRANTSGGQAPGTGCDAGTVGTDTRVSYTADYYFYKGGGPANWLDAPAGAPGALAVPAGNILAVHDHAIGVQVYTCTDGGAAAHAWVLKGPDAVLYDASFKAVGTHGVGPNWISTVDGSAVNGTKVAQANAALPGAVAWLLLKAASTSGSGVFTRVSYVQRLNTNGGSAPRTGCAAGTAGTETRIPYSADYEFYTAGPANGGTD